VVVSSGDRIERVSRYMVGNSFLGALLNPGERPIASGLPVEDVYVRYKPREIEILGWRAHWLVVFFVLSIGTGLIFKGFFRVEI
jgi:hypothetical protein